MANPVKGELAFEVEGKPYRFVLGTYAMAVIERKSGIPTFKFFARASTDWGISDMLTVFHAGLLRHQKLMSEEEASDIVDALGQQRVAEIIREAIQLAYPDATGGAASTGTVRPLRKTGGGKHS